MNYKILIIIIFAFFLVGCEQNKLNKIEIDKKNRSLRFSLAVCTLKDRLKNEL